jgi:ketosteroid isomerase-like protein
MRLLARDNRIPKPLRWLAAIGLLPIPGPVDEALLLLVAPAFLLFYRQPMREAWARAIGSSQAERGGLMAGHIDRLKQGYEQFSSGDIQAATEDWTEDFTWQGGNSEDMPGGGEHKGKDKALEVLGQAVGAWDDFKLSADEFFEEGDTAVVLGHTNVKKGDQSEEMPVVHIWRFDGDQPCRLQILTDTLQGARLLGAV